ncbi:Hypothetical protein PBC10988_2270 [Planctomycetales bacterium 10988]|nr:Hypothetical protein PBC10988_2270 [Planctomycetales bacterium 10988]
MVPLLKSSKQFRIAYYSQSLNGELPVDSPEDFISLKRICKQKELQKYHLHLVESDQLKENLSKYWNIPKTAILNLSSDHVFLTIRSLFLNWQQCKITIRKKRPRLAFYSPVVPDRSGVAFYSTQTFPALSEYVEIDLYTPTKVTDSLCGIERAFPLSEAPYYSSRYDSILSVVGNSPFHKQIIQYLTKHGSACLAHDARICHIMRDIYGCETFAERTSQLLQRTVTPTEIDEWFLHQEKLPLLYFEDVVPYAQPMFVHSRQLQKQMRERYQLQAKYLPFCVYRDWSEENLTEKAKLTTREALGLPKDALIFISLGMMQADKGVFECLEGLHWLHRQGIDAHLYFIGSENLNQQQENFYRTLKRLKLDKSIHITGKWTTDEVWDQFLVAADFGIQLRKHGFGGVSGCLSDCILAGLPTIANEDLAEAIESPEYVKRVSDQFDGEEIGKAMLAFISDSAQNLPRKSIHRDNYLKKHCFENYALQLVEGLGLASIKAA